jgi:hypothetical protein
MKDLVEYSEFKENLAEIKDTCNFIPDVTTDEGYQKSKRVSLDVGKVLTALEKKRKELKADALEFGRKVDSEAKSIKEELESFQLPHKEAYKELDNLKKQREADRKAELERRVAEIKDLPELMRDSSSDEIKMALESLAVEECLDFYEYTELALKARNASKTALGDMFGEALKREQEAIDLARLRKEEEERKQREREEQIRQEEAEKARKEQERLEAEKAAAELREKEAERAAAAAEKARVEAEEKAKRDAEEAKRMAEAAAERAAQIAREEEIARQEREKREAEEAARKREESKRHVSRIRKEAKEDLMALGVSEEQAKDIVLAIHNAKIANIFIRY